MKLIYTIIIFLFLSMQIIAQEKTEPINIIKIPTNLSFSVTDCLANIADLKEENPIKVKEPLIKYYMTNGLYCAAYSHLWAPIINSIGTVTQRICNICNKMEIKQPEVWK